MQNVELVFGTKRELLKTVVDIATAGDDEPIPVSERDWVRRAQATSQAGDLLEIVAAAWVRAISERAAGVLAVAYQAAVSEQIAALARQFEQQR